MTLLTIKETENNTIFWPFSPYVLRLKNWAPIGKNSKKAHSEVCPSAEARGWQVFLGTLQEHTACRQSLQLSPPVTPHPLTPRRPRRAFRTGAFPVLIAVYDSLPFPCKRKWRNSRTLQVSGCHQQRRMHISVASTSRTLCVCVWEFGLAMTDWRHSSPCYSARWQTLSE